MMSSRFPEFNQDLLKLAPLAKRKNDLTLADISDIKKNFALKRAVFRSVASGITTAKTDGSSVILMMGAHVIRSGVQRYLIDLMEKGFISCIATNGAGAIHDFEFALIGATTESVAHYIKDGHFGLWEETGRINDIVSKSAKNGKGLGEAVGCVIEEEQFP
ncbi:MAG: hypothetical protein DRI57_20500 [Deltaproteobacteria bacterium]|nr:MAG: hypothetical protein DRI57_20500 [Deltaproteobacteria bacterium]